MSDVINGEILGNLIFVLRSVGLLPVQVTKAVDPLGVWKDKSSEHCHLL